MSPERDSPAVVPERLKAAPRPGQGRRPTAQVRSAILEAAGRLLLAEGMAGFTIERVAALAGASKMTIYKMWPSKGALALAGYFTTVEPALAFPDTDDIEADLIVQLTAFVRLLDTTRAGPVIAGLIGQAQTDSELAAAYQQQYSRPRRAVAVEAIGRAQTRGQIDPTVDPEVLVDQLWGACYHRLLLPDQPLTEQFAVALVHNLLHGVRRRDVEGSEARESAACARTGIDVPARPG
ncbi:TetR/AcrR family transcriptional regulator [Agilicoccus flavus]|uniref:TetR/AcrR family transcriptional regulator n=1 Tax=Agilicoccus flavus TaxID=2775968 RepID=UPI001CF6A37D|nr:TetR/AcrR family transcriptional regulator [Agilicoccus flavus]